MAGSEVAEHVAANREYWDGVAEDWVASGERSWATSEPNWGIWCLPETELGLLPESMAGMAAVELGCGTGYVSAWMRRRGASVVAVDVSSRQLETAKRLAEEHGLKVDFRMANAEETGLPAESFDFAISEYGAAIWCEPRAWLTEAHRLLRPGGQLVFLGNSPWALVCTPESGDGTASSMQRPYFEMGRLDFRTCDVDPGGIEFNMPVSEWFSLFKELGFCVDDYLELRAPKDAQGPRHFTTAAWGRAYPAEHVWKLRKKTH